MAIKIDFNIDQDNQRISLPLELWNQIIASIKTKQWSQLEEVTSKLLEPNTKSISNQEMLSLPLEERRKILAKQAEEMLSYYEETADERELWQGGDIYEY